MLVQNTNNWPFFCKSFRATSARNVCFGLSLILVLALFQALQSQALLLRRVFLAAWRVHASAAELERRLGNQRAAERHRSLGRSTVLALANSLVDYERLRETFLAAPPVRAIIDPGRG